MKEVNEFLVESALSMALGSNDQLESVFFAILHMGNNGYILINIINIRELATVT